MTIEQSQRALSISYTPKLVLMSRQVQGQICLASRFIDLREQDEQHFATGAMVHAVTQFYSPHEKFTFMSLLSTRVRSFSQHMLRSLSFCSKLM
jgi:hypothetical protein